MALVSSFTILVLLSFAQVISVTMASSTSSTSSSFMNRVVRRGSMQLYNKNNIGVGRTSAFIPNDLVHGQHQHQYLHCNQQRFSSSTFQSRSNPSFLNLPIQHSLTFRHPPRKSLLSTRLLATKKNDTFQPGEYVQILVDNIDIMNGTITQRKSGWYTVSVMQEGGIGGDECKEYKRRASQITKLRNLDQTPVFKGDATSSLPTSASSPSSSNANAALSTSSTSSSSSSSSSPMTSSQPLIEEPTQLRPSKEEESRSSFSSTTSIQDFITTETIENMPSLPTMVNLDAVVSNQNANQDNVMNKKDVQYIQQCKEFTKYKKWVMFTDLHVSPTSLNTCMNVLRRVHEVAKEQDAGILFLGDFWHHRGTVRVDCLNAVLNELSDWEVPMIMIPGNHDQVTLSGLEHALTPLKNAYRINTKDDTILRNLPGILIFSHPTKIHNAMFVPHIRDIATMQSVLQSNMTRTSSAVFIHADVTGAYMNDMILSTHGVAPVYFPPNVPIYSGHFHKPHVVLKEQAAPGVKIRYVGSPYETTLSESGQEKSLVVLDASQNWESVEEIPLNIGKKHWRAQSIEKFLELKLVDNTNDSITGPIKVVMPGDRVVVSVHQEKLDIERQEMNEAGLGLCAFDKKVKAIRAIGASVEIRDIKSVPSQILGNETNGFDEIDLDWLLVEDLKPKTIWSNFLDNELKRDAIMNETAANVLEAGMELLDEIDCDVSTNEAAKSYTKNAAMLVLEELIVQGFGPFKDEVTYPLKERGLVLVKGSNHDVGSDSNGTGKSSLAMSTLWALTGSIDPRPVQDDKVSDVINDFSKSAKVTVRGTIDKSSFVITRTKTLSRGTLTFILDGTDLTRQSIKETQLVIDEKLGADSQVLSRTIFHGQHALNGLLEATDGKFKDELSLIVALKIWQDAATYTRKKGRALSSKVLELSGMISIREKDIETISRKIDFAKETVATKENELSKKEYELLKYTHPVQEENETIDVEHMQNVLAMADEKGNLLEKKQQVFRTMYMNAISPIKLNIDEFQTKLGELGEQLAAEQRQSDRHEVTLESAQQALYDIEKKWGILKSDNLDSFIPPTICPTCKQPTNDAHTHEHIKFEVTNEMNDIEEKIRSILSLIKVDELKVAYMKETIDAIKIKMHSHEKVLEEEEKEWQERSFALQNEVEEARAQYTKLSSTLASDLEKIEYQNSLQQMKSNALAEVTLYKNNLNMAQERFDATKEELESMTQNIKSLKEEQETKRTESATILKVAELFGARGVQTFVLQNAVLALQLVTQSYLDELSDGNLSLQLELDDGDRISRKVSILGPDGAWIERPLSSLSGGQWRRCSLAISLGFSDLVARRGRLSSSLLVLDEPLTHLDSSGRDNVGKLLRKIIHNQSSDTKVGIGGLSVSTIIIILQDLVAEELSESFDCIDEVVKAQGHSKVLVDELTESRIV